MASRSRGLRASLPIDNIPAPMPTSNKFQNTVDSTELRRPNDLTVSADSE